MTNVGTAPVSDIHMRIDPPVGTWVQLENFPADDWQCDVTAAPWICTHGTLAPEAISVINIPVMFPAGPPPRSTATAATPSGSRPGATSYGSMLAPRSSSPRLTPVTTGPTPVTVTAPGPGWDA